MPYITVPNTLVNGAVADSTQLNQNFAAITDGLTDGTKDIKVSSISVGDMTVTDTLSGSRQFFVWTGFLEGNTTGYLSPDPYTKPIAYPWYGSPMPYSGSIISITSLMYVSQCANAQTITPRIVKASGSSVVAAASTLTISAAVTGIKTGVASNYARGAYPFSMGDDLCAHVVMSGTAGSAAMCGRFNILAEVYFN
jgi:hypothetical protein